MIGLIVRLMRFLDLFLRGFDRIHHCTRPPRLVAAGYGELQREANQDQASAPGRDGSTVAYVLRRLARTA
jgi:hypothetical protein